MKIIKYLILGFVALIAFMGVRTFVVLPAGDPVSLKEVALDEAEVLRVAGNDWARLHCLAGGTQMA